MSENPEIIRRAGPGDEGTLAQLCEEIHKQHEGERSDIFKPYNPEALEAFYGKALGEEDPRFWIAEVDGESVGFISGSLKSREETAFSRAWQWCEIDIVTVQSAFKRHGIGRRLMETAMADFQAQGIEIFELSTWWFNKPAQAFFNKLGFHPRILRMERWDT